MVAKYKLEMVEVDENGKQYPMCTIGTFDDEDALIEWAKSNRGEIKKRERSE